MTTLTADYRASPRAIAGARSKQLRLRKDDVQVLHGFGSVVRVPDAITPQVIWLIASW